MTISKANFEILKRAALAAAQTSEILKAIQDTENAAAEASRKTSAYIMERRKKDKYYCR